jgi:sirohydrochlorin cobaltochelatase
MTQAITKGVVLVGHGGVPKDFPRDLVAKLKGLEGRRRATNSPPSAEESDLDAKIRHWPRTPQNDPYKVGLETLAEALRQRLNGDLFGVAYNEFCTPTLEEVVTKLVAAGAERITVIPSMLTPGGSHSELEIPETLAQLRAAHPTIDFRYAWPFDLSVIASMLAQQLQRF